MKVGSIKNNRDFPEEMTHQFIIVFKVIKQSYDLCQPIVIDSLPENIIRNSLVKAMAESPTGLSEIEFMDCDDLNYEMDFDVDILDGFNLENTLYHVNLYVFYFM